MNKQNRARVAELIEQLQKAQALVEQIGSDISALAEEEREKFENMSEGLQQSPTGEAIDNAATLLEEAAEAAESGNVTEALEALEQVE